MESGSNYEVGKAVSFKERPTTHLATKQVRRLGPFLTRTSLFCLNQLRAEGGRNQESPLLTSKEQSIVGRAKGGGHLPKLGRSLRRHREIISGTNDPLKG
jgi:hypothetical protein